VLEERVPNSYKPQASGNNFLFQLLGAEAITVVPGGTDLMAAMQAVADEVRAQGRTPYIIPGGGSNSLGALGYVACVEEVMAQSFDLGLKIDHFVCSSGSGGTHAGIVTGFEGLNTNIPVTGISVRAEKIAQENKLHLLANEAAERLGIRGGISREAFTVFDDYVGEGYSLPTEGMIEAVQLFARLEGILLDPVYTGKTAAGLIDLVRKGHFKAGETLLFLHTGGSPALYAYQQTLLGD
jgi:D-cysteine desulfhydrase